MINPSGKNLSIIMTGVIGTHTVENIRQIKRIYPLAELVVSSFDKRPPSFSSFSLEFIQSRESSSLFRQHSGHEDNLGRQILQITTALAKTSGEVVLRLRTDTTLISEIPVDLLKEGKILIPSVFTRNPAKYPLLFHPSDVFAMGARRDIENFYKASLAEIQPQFPTCVTQRRWIPLGKNAVTLFPEQRLCLNYFNSLERESQITLPFASCFSFKLFRMSEKLMKKYFDVIPEGIVVYPNHFRFIRPGINTTYKYADWNKSDTLYRRGIRIVNACLMYYIGTNLNWRDLRSKVSYFIDRDKNLYRSR